MTKHPKQSNWLTEEEIDKIHGDLIKKQPVFKNAEFVNKPSSGIINMFEFWDEKTDVFSYHDLNGVKQFTSLDMMEHEQAVSGYFGF